MKTSYLTILALCGAMLLISGAVAADSATSLTISGTVISAEEPVADFTANQTIGYAPLVIRFTDTSTGSPGSWEWDFDADGTIDAAVPDPVQVYSVPGVYTVTLTVRNAGGSDTEVKLHYITVKQSTARAKIEALKQYIHLLPIPRWSQWFLTMPLDRAVDQLEKGHNKPAVNQMKVFIQFVELLDRFHVITHSQAGYMTSEAQAIIDLIPAK
jgi:PKD repeat protein